MIQFNIKGDIMKTLSFISLLLLALPFSASGVTATCGWEGTETILGNNGDIIASIVTDPVHAGNQSLKLEDAAESGTPQAFVGWITGLTDGEIVSATVWRYDVTPAGAPSCRIWAHWNDDPTDITVDSGSASGQTAYGPGTGWDMAEYAWTVVNGHTGLVIEIRTYSNPGDIVFIDDLTITAPDGTTIIVPSDFVSLERQSWAGIKYSF
jgi:hypothetical protein